MNEKYAWARLCEGERLADQKRREEMTVRPSSDLESIADKRMRLTLHTILRDLAGASIRVVGQSFIRVPELPADTPRNLFGEIGDGDMGPAPDMTFWKIPEILKKLRGSAWGNTVQPGRKAETFIGLNVYTDTGVTLEDVWALILEKHRGARIDLLDFFRCSKELDSDWKQGIDVPRKIWSWANPHQSALGFVRNPMEPEGNPIPITTSFLSGLYHEEFSKLVEGQSLIIIPSMDASS